MGGSGVKGWGWYAAGNAWVPLSVDATGHLKADLSGVTLGSLGDVNVPAPADDQFLYWDDVAGKWQVRALADGDIPAAIARDAEVATAVSDHKDIVDAHHGKTVSADIDHGAVGGLADDDHAQYHSDARGDARYLWRENVAAFTPTADYHPATKKYVDAAGGGGALFEAAQIGSGATHGQFGILLGAAGHYAVIEVCAPSNLVAVDAAMLVVRNPVTILGKKVVARTLYGQSDGSEPYGTHDTGLVDKIFTVGPSRNQVIDLTADFAAMTADDCGWVQIAYKDTQVHIVGLMLEYH